MNDYVHIEAADLRRPNARFTTERQGYQVLTPFGKLGYSRLVDRQLPIHIALGLVATSVIASSNYVINELLDARHDRMHPDKASRPVPSGLVGVKIAYVQWLVLAALGFGVASLVSTAFTVTMVMFWGMGCVYNLPPLRAKDRAYLDVPAEGFNNPLRLLGGWYVAGATAGLPVSLFLSYWMIGCYFMTMKRYAELRHIADHERAAAYRASFARYSEHGLLVAVMFYGSASMLFFGAFIIRYRMELILAFPMVSLFMAMYLSLGLRENSVVQRPERLYREARFMAVFLACVVLIGILFFVDVPFLHRFFAPTAPTNSN